MTRNVLEWLEDAARRAPEAMAFEDGTTGMTYCQLLTRAQEIGSFLLAHVRAQQGVLLLMDKGPDCVAAMLGAAYAGDFYTPLDPAMPLQRMGLIANVLQPACVVCSEKYREAARHLAGERPVFAAEDIPHAIDCLALKEQRRQHIDTDLLYVLFTSGSTGVPKGVAITHRSVADFVFWACDALDIGPDDRLGNQAPLYFDNSVLDIYCAIRMGACVHFIPRKYFTFPHKMTAYLQEQRITAIFWVPSALIGVAASGALEQCAPDTLRCVWFCGETMPCKTLNAWKRALPQARFVNMYGPTEITDVCTFFPVERDFADEDVLPIGFPCANSRIILDEGEICVTGTCLSPGYYNAPEQTARAFVPNPYRQGVTEIMYRTGDLGAYNDRGELMFLGRRDGQIKRQGYRIELSEIECALCAHPQVAAGCVLYDAAAEKILAVYAGEAEEKALRAHLKERIPKYMLPDAFIVREQLPLTGNGKIDRIQLKQEYT